VTSHVDALRAELHSIKDGYIALREAVADLAHQATELQTRWNSTGLSSNAKYFDMANGDVAEFHRDLNSLGPAAFGLGVNIGLVANHL
jgi:hypothetical protein